MAIKLLNLFSLLFIITSTSTTSLSPSLTNQASTLLIIKHSFHDPKPLLHSWSPTNLLSPCSWTGILCTTTNTSTSITSVDISNSNISGNLPSSITHLPSLRHLNISNNQFNGSFWFNFTTMLSLEVLDIYNNDFSGPLPLTITLLPNLQHLDLGGNYFSGSIPPSYGHFRELTYLSLSGNNLQGPIPPELGNISSLNYLYLGYYNQFTGGVPPQLGSLTNLIHLDLANCGLSGSIPPELSMPKNLNTLFLQFNQLSGEIPTELGNLSSLRFLDLSNNALTGEIPATLSELRELTLLHLFINRLHGEIPEFIAELPNLEFLKLWQNNFTGAIPAQLGRHCALRELDLSTNKLTGFIPSFLCSGRSLEILILLNNFLFGPLPADLGGCRTLTRVRMGQNYLTGRIPYGFLYLPELKVIELQNNYLSGEIAEGPNSRPVQLTLLNLFNNRLSGRLPSSIGKFSSLQIILFGGNRLSGEIPPQLGLLRQVSKIDLSANNFSGRIPPEISSCSLLTYLDLSRNRLTGAIPVAISEIRILNHLNLSWNNLNRSIPREIGAMRSLTEADFSHNNLSGTIPEFAYINASAFLANPLLCGAAASTCTLKTLRSSTTAAQQHFKSKLILALGLLACSIVFAATVVIKTVSVFRNADTWRLTAFQKLDFGCADIQSELKEECIIGRGGAGVVYAATMPNGLQVAVKRLLAAGNGPGRDNGLAAEIGTLGKIRHRNIVRLLAFCTNKDTNLLVYEFMMNGSLGEVLHGKRGGVLRWEIRVRIAIEAARGLCYLHHDCCPPILHRDVKANNILLDAEFEAHVADFGLAKFMRDTGGSECMSAIAGSYGYIAPEYAYTLRVDEKSDVYSYGVVLLELISGRRPVGDFGEEGVDIVQWAKMETNWSKEGVAEILDRRLSGVDMEEAMQVFFVGMLCVQERSVERPTMREVVQMLEQATQKP